MTIDRRTLTLGGILLVGAGARGAMMLRRRPAARTRTSLADDLPARVGARSIAAAEAPMLPQRDATTDQIYDDFVARSYRGAGVAPVTLLIAYGGNQDGGLEVHRPENCYPPFGFSLGPSRPVRLQLADGRAIAATALTATRDGVADQLLFWTRVGRDFPTSQWQTDLSIMYAALRGETPDGVLVRLSMTTGNAEEGDALLAAFARDLIAGVPERIRPLLVGNAGA